MEPLMDDDVSSEDIPTEEFRDQHSSDDEDENDDDESSETENGRVVIRVSDLIHPITLKFRDQQLEADYQVHRKRDIRYVILKKD